MNEKCNLVTVLLLCCLIFPGNAQEFNWQDLVNRKQYAAVIAHADSLTLADSSNYEIMNAMRLLRGAQHYCARNEFFCTFDAAWALYAVYGRRRSSVPACGCSGGAERRRDNGASGKTDHAAFGTTLLGRVSWDHRDYFGSDAGDCAVF